MSRRGPDRNTTDQILALIPALRLLARGFLCDPEAADDLVQETLARALGGISGFTPGTDLRAWLFVIMRNSLRSDLRRDRRQASGGAGAAGATCPPIHDIGIGCAQMLAALRRLPQPYREALIVVFLMENSHDEAARICGCPVGTIKSRISRARAMLMADLGAHSLAEMIEAG